MIIWYVKCSKSVVWQNVEQSFSFAFSNKLVKEETSMPDSSRSHLFLSCMKFATELDNCRINDRELNKCQYMRIGKLFFVRAILRVDGLIRPKINITLNLYLKFYFMPRQCDLLVTEIEYRLYQATKISIAHISLILFLHDIILKFPLSLSSYFKQ